MIRPKKLTVARVCLLIIYARLFLSRHQQDRACHLAHLAKCECKQCWVIIIRKRMIFANRGVIRFAIGLFLISHLITLRCHCLLQDVSHCYAHYEVMHRFVIRLTIGQGYINAPGIRVNARQ